MGLLLTLIVGLSLWIILFATGLMKSFDAFLIAMLLVLLAATARLVTPYLPGGRAGDDG
jgi:Mn2+/Fe2+ NRAMP family transporter